MANTSGRLDRLQQTLLPDATSGGHLWLYYLRRPGGVSVQDLRLEVGSDLPCPFPCEQPGFILLERDTPFSRRRWVDDPDVEPRPGEEPTVEPELDVETVNAAMEAAADALPTPYDGIVRRARTLAVVIEARPAEA